MRNFTALAWLPAGLFVIGMGAVGVLALGQVQTLPAGAGAIGKGPDALTLRGYEDVPRPPAFNDKKRAETAEQEKAVDNYTPQPAWAGQTRAPKPAKIAAYEVQTAAEGLFSPWGFSFLPDGRILVSETGKGLRILDKNGRGGEYITGLPIDFSRRGQQLLDTIPDKDFSSNRVIYFLYRVPPPEAGDIGRREEDFPIHYPQIEMVGRGRLLPDDKSLTDVKVLLNTQGIEGRMIQAPDGTLFIDSGPLAGRGILSRNWTQSQLPGSLMGKVLHINSDGSIPKDNPFIGRPDTRPEIWAFGVRDAQSMAFDARGRLWTAENGPMGGDELNLIQRGRNYGWPRASNGSNYDGSDIPDHRPGDGFEPPKVWWNPSISPASLIIYSGGMFPQWRGDAIIGALSGEALIRVHLDGENASKADQWPMGARIREVEQAPDGAVWLLQDGPSGGRLLRLTPRRGS